MNILIIGSGAREHAMAQSFSRSAQQPTLFCYGNTLNPGILKLTHEFLHGDVKDVNAILEAAKQWQIDLAIIGPEAPLACGVADALLNANILTVGPTKKLARIESDKAFARVLMQQYGIVGCPQYQLFRTMNGIEAFLKELGDDNYVIKANGLMGGKGVKVAGDHLHSFVEALQFCEEILNADQTVVIEEKLIGQEFSFMCFSDGERVVPMPLVQDHKRAFNDDKGPNTGGMGSYSDANHALPFLTEAEISQAAIINQNILAALANETGQLYRGILYGSFIATAKGIYVIEFNARFGDPEALNVLSILESDFVELCKAIATGTMTHSHVQFAEKATVCKYVVPEGYPNQPLENQMVDFTDVANQEQLYIAAVNAIDGLILATHSRTAAFVGIADTIAAAESIAEKEISAIKGKLFHRTDIGTTKLVTAKINFMHELRKACA